MRSASRLRRREGGQGQNKERERFHMIGMTFSSKEKEEAYLAMIEGHYSYHWRRE